MPVTAFVVFKTWPLREEVVLGLFFVPYRVPVTLEQLPSSNFIESTAKRKVTDYSNIIDK